ncbi:MAG TPA: DUF3006 family protein [Pseudogracilibacillus sp.]|nr:DUF3006 family protein [Pseudogracilibacillus sp.]
MLGFLDRIEEDLAVILVEETVNEFTVHTEDLPANSEVGTIFNLDFDGENYQIVSINEEETEKRKETSVKLLQKLQKRKKKSKFKRN